MMDKMIFLKDEAEANEEQKLAKQKRSQEILSQIDSERLAVKDFRIQEEAKKI
jgi:hypothetical protein